MAGLSRCLARCRSSRQGWHCFIASPVCGRAGPAAPAPAGSVNAGQGTAGPASPGGSGADAVTQTGSDIPSPAPRRAAPGVGFVWLERSALQPAEMLIFGAR